MRSYRWIIFVALAAVAACADDQAEQVIGPPPAVGCCWGRLPDGQGPVPERPMRLSIKGETGSGDPMRITMAV